MLRLKYIIGLVLILMCLLLVIYRQGSFGPAFSEEEMTPQQMLAEELARKGKRRDDGIYKRFDQPEEYIAYHRLIRTREGEEEPGYDFGYRLQHMLLVKSAKASYHKLLNEVWKERGPSNVPGRTRGLIIDPADPTESTWLAGTVGGGIWKTTDRGQSWRILTPDLPNLATTVLAFSEANPDIIYAGTGEGWYGTGMIDGDGIFKSTDRGESWFQLPATAFNDDFQNINRIIVDPQNPELLLACSNTGARNSFRSSIMRSTDGGISWQNVFQYHDRIQHLIFHPSDFSIQYAAIFGRGVYKSTDAGITWFPSLKGLAPDGRVEIAISPTNPQVLYASCEGVLTGAYSDLYITEDAGNTWQLLIPASGERIYEFLGGQGWFNNTIAVHPFDDRQVYFGGVNLFKATLRDQTGNLSAFLGVDYEQPQLIGLVNFGAALHQGRIATGDIDPSEFTSVEVRFGTGKKQKAHRFTVNKLEAGVPPSGYFYQDYVEVPFEVWDIDNNRQLMISFRDQQEDGEYELIHFDSDNPGREYIYIHAIPYSLQPDDDIAKDAGHVFRQMYMIWPYLEDEQQWNPPDLPESVLRIRFGQIGTRNARFQVLSDAYSQFGGMNSYSNSGFHPDHHNLILKVADPEEKTFWILNANDGGVFYTEKCTEPGTRQGDWIFAGNGLNNTQFYGADKHPGIDRYIGGSQDNGTWFSPAGKVADPETQYQFVIGGDGFETVWHHEEPQKIIGGSQFNNFRRSFNGGQTWQTMASSGLTDRGSSGVAPFVSRLANSKHDPNVLYTVGQKGVWRSDNFSLSWKVVNTSEYWNFGSTQNVEISLSDYGIIWAGGSMSNVGRLHVSADYGKTFKAVNNYSQPMGRISGLATHPTQDSTAYALFSFARAPKILRTLDLGETWEDISGFGQLTKSQTGFPDVAVYCLLVMPHDPDIIWAGTEIGLVQSLDNGETWHLYQGGLPSVSVWDMKVVDDQVVVATHGRGIWTASIEGLNLRPFVRSLVQVEYRDKMLLRADLNVAFDSVQVYLNNIYQHSLLQPFTGNNIVNLNVYAPGMQKAMLIGYLNGKPYPSAKALLEVDKITSADDPLARNQLLLYPNPARSGVYLQVPGAARGDYRIAIFDNRGRIVHQEDNLQHDIHYLNLGHLPKGTYHIRVVQDRNTFTEKLILAGN